MPSYSICYCSTRFAGSGVLRGQHVHVSRARSVEHRIQSEDKRARDQSVDFCAAWLKRKVLYGREALQDLQPCPLEGGVCGTSSAHQPNLRDWHSDEQPSPESQRNSLCNGEVWLQATMICFSKFGFFVMYSHDKPCVHDSIIDSMR